MTIYQQLDAFLAGKQRNLWLCDDKIKVYVRRAIRRLDGETNKDGFLGCKTLDIATVDVFEEFQNQGVFTKFLDYAIRVNPFDYLYVENVLTARFRNYFRRRGWKPTASADWCFFLGHNSANCEAVPVSKE